jgi:16S rRNA (adenine1518-N6/adenine1519-N6)-dimethyltransferase
MAVPTTKTALRAFLGAAGIRPRRLQGQNFLADRNLVAAIAREAGAGPRDCVLEVGTGTGILTEALAETAGCVVTCDVDASLQELARGARAWPENVVFLAADILDGKHRLAPDVVGRWRAEREARGLRALRVVANLPYAIATPFLANLLWEGVEARDALVLVQREAAERLLARPGTRAYGPVSVAVALFARARVVRHVPPQVFWPEPKVHSALLHLEIVDPDRARRLRAEGLERLLHDAFLHRRKMLRSSLPRERLAAAGVPEDARPEEVGSESWVALLRAAP